MSVFSAYLGVAGLGDVGYRFYDAAEAGIGSRTATGVRDAGDGWYSVDVTMAGGAVSVRWDSAANPTTLCAREYFSAATATVDNAAIAAAVWQVLTSGLTTTGSVGKLIVDNLDAKVSTRSTYTGIDTSGTTTLLSRIASALTITSGKVDVNDKTGFALTSAYDPAKTAAQAGNAMTLTAAYDPAKTAAQAGAAMTLTSAYDAAKSAASQASVNTIDDFVDTEVGAIKVVTDKLDTALELDGAVYRYTVNALEQAPVGGGGGATDWTAPEREQIRHRLGIDGTATSPSTGTPSLALQSTSSAIMAKTNALPSDPADASDIAASFTTVNGKLDTIDDFIDTEINAIKLKTDQLQFTGTDLKATLDGETVIVGINNDKSGYALTPAYDAAKVAASQSSLDATKVVTDKLNTTIELDGAVYRFTVNALEQAPTGGGGGTIDNNAIADAVLTRDWTAVTGEADDSLLQAVRSIRNKWQLSVDGTLTVFKEDGTTVAWTRVVQSDPAAIPITGMS